MLTKTINRLRFIVFPVLELVKEKKTCDRIVRSSDLNLVNVVL